MRKKNKILVTAATLLLPSVFFGQITSESENNNSESNADGPVGSGVLVEGTIGNNSDIDWFTFDVGGSGTINITLDHASNDDFDWDLYKSTGGAVASGATGNDPETGSYSATTAETYFLKVSRYRGRGWYDLTVTYPTGGGSGGGGGGGTGGGLGSRPSKPSNISSWITGSSSDSSASTSNGPAILLMGGNFDIDEAFINRAYPVVNGGDVVVLRSSGTDGYNDYLFNLTTGSLQPDSIETIVVDSVSKANTDYVEWVLKSAEMVYIAGGDQSDYLNYWQGTKVESAIKYAYDQGAVIGGISAGCAVQGEFIYDPDGIPGIYSSEAVSDMCHPNMNISNNFFDFPLMSDFITDTHFAQRNRMGRLMGMMAAIGDSEFSPSSTSITGIGVDEDTSLFIDKNRVGYVDGDFGVYILREDSQTDFTQLSCGNDLIYGDVNRTKLTAGDTFNFNTGSNTGTSIRVDVDGGSCSYSFTQEADCFYSPSNVY